MKVPTGIFAVALIAACSASPETPYSYDSPAVELRFNFIDTPSSPDLTALLSVRPVSYPPDVGAPSFDDCSGPHVTVNPFFNSVEPIQVPSFSASPYANESEMCSHRDLAALHFMKVWGQLISEGGVPVGFWGPGAWGGAGAWDLVYAPTNTDFRPFGPSGAVASIPKGYSWLHRTCGPTGTIELGIVPTRSTVDMHRSDEGSPLSVNGTEEALADACRFQRPKEDLGTRVAFDRAQQIIWSADDASLFYLSIPDDQGRTIPVGIRQVRLAEQSISELAAVPGALYLQTGATGVLYVTSDAQETYDVSDLAATAKPLPKVAMSHPRLSPDGRWFAYDSYYGSVRLWPLSGLDNLTSVTGSFVGWSPDSRLVYGPARPEVPPAQSPTDQQPYQLFTVSPEALDNPVSCGSVSAEQLVSISTLGWSSPCPQLAYAPRGWSIESSIPTPDCEHCFGLDIQDPVTGAERIVLDASAGLIRQAGVRPSPEFVFAWARTCWGLYNTVCTFSLLRVRLADGTVQTVASADEEMPVALSWDSRRIALAASDGIYVKDLPP